MALVGRKPEIELLKSLENSDKSELVAIYGRRRIGKTYLIREVYKNKMIFDIIGLHNGNLKDQLQNFTDTLNAKPQYKKTKISRPSSWREAFILLGNYIDKIKNKQKKIIFIDEFPWMATRRSNFLMWFENFWNSYCTKRNDLIVVVCGSAASYMVKDIIKNKGGLHNRITQKIRLLPFNLHETKLFLESKNIKFHLYDYLQIYMAIGGIPYYLEMLQKGKSVSQNIDTLCFAEAGMLHNEFNEVFTSLFNKSEIHKKIIRLLATNKGLSQKEILNKLNLKQSGYTSNIFNELLESGFISQYTPYNKKLRNSLFRLSDEYCMFYLKFIEPNKATGKGTWQKLSAKQTYKVWSGFAFETICTKHIQQIKHALGIGKVFTIHSAWKSDKAQIDIIIDRDDNIINICEIKFYNKTYTLDKNSSKNIENKLNSFKEITQTKKIINTTLITTFGTKTNSYYLNSIDEELKMDCLFQF
ncbi:MAG: AAA family ATPase [Bacteroidales bacterium]|nr:AAA family ATPase [Bacteroidales bacterium]